jgi:DinB superfamily
MIYNALGGARHMENILCSILLTKIEHQIDRIDHLVKLIPDARLNWAPPIPNAFSVSVLLGHLMESLSGFCAVLHAAYPERLRHFFALKALSVTPGIGTSEARSRIGMYHAHIREGFAELQDRDLARALPTVFVPEGEPLLSLLVVNYEHLASHKYQLFMYLRLLDVKVASQDLYHFSGA